MYLYKKSIEIVCVGVFRTRMCGQSNSLVVSEEDRYLRTVQGKDLRNMVTSCDLLMKLNLDLKLSTTVSPTTTKPQNLILIGFVHV